MKKIQTFLSLAALIVVGVLSLNLTTPKALAITCPDGSWLPDERANECPPAEGNSSSQAHAPNTCSGTGEDGTEEEINAENCPILGYLVTGINTLSALAGVAIIGSIIFGGIQYSMAGSDSSKVSAAKGRIRNAIIALLLFLFGYGILNFLVPGGVLPG